MFKITPLRSVAAVGIALVLGCGTTVAVASSSANTDPHNGNVVDLGHDGVSKWCDGHNLVYQLSQDPHTIWASGSISAISQSPECQ